MFTPHEVAGGLDAARRLCHTRVMIETIAPGDRMFKDNRDHYFSVGRSALHTIEVAKLAANVATFTNILDLPSGHGRVLRQLQAAYPAAQLTACDIEKEAVDFCAQIFGAKPIYGQEVPQKIPLPRDYDLIWVGSLLTHLHKERCREFLEVFRAVLRPHGLLVFTMHGRAVAQRMQEGKSTYGLKAESIPKVLRDYAANGFGYENYPKKKSFGVSENYGVSLVSPRWLFAQLEKMDGLRLVNFTEQGWDNHQDTVALLRV